MEIHKNNKTYCPICNKKFDASQNANSQNDNQHTRWFKNMISHFKDAHVTSLNNYLGPYNNHYIGYWFKNHDKVESIVNEKVKRQILKKTKLFLNKEGFTLDHFASLGNHSNETMQLASEILKTGIGNSEQ